MTGSRAGFFSPTANYVDKGLGESLGGAHGPDEIVARLDSGLDPVEAHNHVQGMMIAEGDIVVTEHEEEWVFHTGERILHPFASVMVFASTKIERWWDYSTSAICLTTRPPAARTHRSGVPLRREVASLDPVEHGFEAFGEAFFGVRFTKSPPECRDLSEFPVEREPATPRRTCLLTSVPTTQFATTLKARAATRRSSVVPSKIATTRSRKRCSPRETGGRPTSNGNALGCTAATET